MGKTEAGLLLFIESPDRITARWTATHLPRQHAVPLVEALHQDLVSGLAAVEDTTTYLAPLHDADRAYVTELGGLSAVEVLALPEAGGLQIRDSGLSILYNRCKHRKVLCADGQVPELYPDDVLRAHRKLDLYDVVLGREGADGCWLIGMHGYTDFLCAITEAGEGLLHSILESGMERGQQVSLLDTKNSFRSEPSLDAVRFLAARDQHPAVRRLLDSIGILPPPDSAD